jgi:hypothetical protein
VMSVAYGTAAVAEKMKVAGLPQNQVKRLG